MSVAARARVTSGADLWTTHAEPDLALPSLRLSDGPHGVRGRAYDERAVARCTPCGTALAASWDTDLMGRVGRLIGDEARRQGVHVVLGPTLNIPRSPLGGRGFESLSEDPLLSGEMAAAWIAGVQSRGVAACPKHFVANDSETARTTVNCVVDERSLREIYLPPFERAVRSGAWALMAAYNQVNGVHASEHRGLLRDLLKGEWGWDGAVVSDWFGAHDTIGCSVAGLDLEMPGPAKIFGPALAEAVTHGLVAEADLNDKVARLIRLARRVQHAGGESAPPAQPLPAAPRPVPPRPDVLEEAAAAGFVLLTNAARILPLSVGPALTRLALIGPNAWDPCLQGGGSAHVNLAPSRSLHSALAERLPSVGIDLERGCVGATAFPGLHDLRVWAPGEPGVPGIAVEYFAAAADSPGHQAWMPVAREIRNTDLLAWPDGLPTMPSGQPGLVRASAVLEPDRDGAYSFAVKGSGPTRLLVDGHEVAALRGLASSGDPLAAWYSEAQGVGDAMLAAGAPVLVEVEMRHEGDANAVMVIGCRPPEPPDLLERAVALAGAADTVVLVVGTSAEIESESTDRTSTELPREQVELVEAVLDTNQRTIVVVNAGSAIDLPWAARAAAVLYVWFPGDAYPDALAAGLTGELEPGGRLPLTLAASPSHYPVREVSPDETGSLQYDESVFVGYRHFDALGHRPAFCFGHGLGYTDFEYLELTVSASTLRAEQSLSVIVVVRNIGARAGKEVVQLYVSPTSPPLPRPPYELKAFSAIRLEAGASGMVALQLDWRAFAFWDADAAGWRVAPGDYGIHVGRSSRDLRLTNYVRLMAEPGPAARLPKR